MEFPWEGDSRSAKEVRGRSISNPTYQIETLNMFKKIPLSVKVIVSAEMEDGTNVLMRALVDTGSEVNIVWRGLLARKFFRTSKVSARFMASNASFLPGGEDECSCVMGMDVHDTVTEELAE